MKTIKGLFRDALLKLHTTSMFVLLCYEVLVLGQALSIATYGGQTHTKMAAYDY